MNYEEKIEDFVAGTLSEKESGELMELAKVDREIAYKIELEKTLKKGIENSGRSALKKYLMEIDSAQTPIIRSSKTWRPALVAASAIVIASLSVYLTMYGASQASLFKDFYEPYTSYAPITKRGMAKDLSSFELAQKAYEQGVYDKALHLFNSVAKSDERDFYLAHSYLALKEYQKAALILGELKAKEAVPQSTITWYLALAQIKLGEIEKAKENLKYLRQRSNPYQEKADEILNRL